MGLTLATNIGSGLGLSNYFSNVSFTATDYSSSQYIFYNSFLNGFGATLMTTAFHASSSSPPVYSATVYLGHQVAVADFDSFSFLVDASLGGTVGGKPAGEVLVTGFGSLPAFFAENDTLAGNIGNDVLEGYGGADWMTGDAGDDILIGDGSNDTLFGGFGADLLFGGDGDDQLYGGFGADLIDGGAGLDTARYRDSSGAVTISLVAGTIAGGEATGDTYASIENLEGSAFDDTLTGDDGANVLSGDAGNDTLVGGGRNDVLIGGAGRDLLDGGDGIDTAGYDGSAAVSVNLASNVGKGGDAQGDRLISIENASGGGGDDTLIGSTGNNVLVGGIGNDTLSGGRGNDVLEGDGGFDTMTGGAGHDIFKLASVPQPYGNDTINDYVDGVDKISFVGTRLTFDQIRIQDGNGTTFPGSAIVHTVFGDTFLAHTDYTVLDANDFIFDGPAAARPSGSGSTMLAVEHWGVGFHPPGLELV